MWRTSPRRPGDVDVRPEGLEGETGIGRFRRRARVGIGSTGPEGRGRPMITRRIPISLAMAGVLILGVVGVPASAQTGNAVTQWNLITAQTLLAFPGPAGGVPPALGINLAMVQGAVYDAVNSMEPKHFRPYLLQRRFGAVG